MALVKGKFLGNHFEKLILAVCLIGFVLSVVFVLLHLLQPPKDPASSVVAAQKNLEPVDIDNMGIESLLTNRVALTNMALISELRLACTNLVCQKLIKEQARVCPFCRSPQPDLSKRDSDKDGMTDQYELAHGLDPLNQDDYYEDLDDDLFSNGEEFEAGTEPNNPLSHGSYIEKVCLYKSQNRPYKFRFQGVQSKDDTGTNLVFQLNLRTLDRTYFARMHEVIKVVREYKVVKYINRVVTNKNNGFVRDMSEIHIDDGEEVLKMQLGKIVDKNRVKARLLNVLDPDQVLIVKTGSEFSLKKEEFQVIKLSTRTALVKNSATGEEYTVEVCTSEQKREVLRRKKGLRPGGPQSPDYPEGYPAGYPAGYPEGIAPPGYYPDNFDPSYRSLPGIDPPR